MHLTSAGLWLLASGALQATASCDCFVGPITDRDLYLKCAKDYGLCRKKNTASTFIDIEKRPLVIPGGDVLTKFEVCVAKNEFNEELYDTGGSIFCQGLPIHLMADVSYDPTSKDHVDSKTFVDSSRTTSGSILNNDLNKGLKKIRNDQKFTVADFNAWNKGGTKEKLNELNIYTNERFPNTPAFISRIRPQARILRAWTKLVHHKWNNLDRTLLQNYTDYLIPGPGSIYLKDDPQGVKKEKYITSAIRLEHPFVIAGGRFREQYYWDSFFVMEGLLAADMTYLARTTLLNFMDQIKAYGFIPNGARKYYLNRSQPPLFIHMLHAYVNHTGDHYILHEGLPLAERELRWWRKNRSVKVFHGENTHTVYQYRVDATGPRPESYAEDWRSAWCFEDGDKAPTLEDETRLYSQFASGAESGWDYTARWMKEPFDLPQDADKDLKNLKQMKTLEIMRMIPVDLNSIIYRCHVLMADLYELAKDNESPFASQHANIHKKEAAKLHKAILALHWNSEKAAFYDFLLEEDFGGDKKAHHGAQKPFWSAASLAPYWSGIWPSELDCGKKESKEKVMQAFSGVRKLLDTYQGPLPATVVESGQQWDFPNAWPPLQYIAIKAFESIPQKCIEKTKVNDFIRTQVPDGQLGMKKDGQPWKIPEQEGEAPKPNYYVSHSWRDSMIKTLAMRYITAAFCSWNDCGKFPEDRAELIERDNPILDAALRDHPGFMYEKLDATSPTEPGGGGEYKVQTGFGWTNGVAIWIAHQYGAILDDPKCPAPKNPECPDEPRFANASMAMSDMVFQW